METRGTRGDLRVDVFAFLHEDIIEMTCNFLPMQILAKERMRL